MEIKPSSEKRFALLIDADNVSAKYIKPILDELSKYGTVTYKRIYGDWTLTLHAKWKEALLDNSITPIQQFGYTQGKNATDSAMIIDAMDILYTDSVEGFCIVSSDSDFTRLASRLRESGRTVIGMGEKKTPIPFRKACDIFTTLELLLPDGGAKTPARGKGHGAQTAGSGMHGSGPSIEDVERAVIDIITDNLNNGKATGVGEVGSRLLKRFPDFDVRSYGTNQLTKLLGEFKSVQTIKEGNSIAIELTEAAEQVREAASGKGAAPAAGSEAADADAAASEGHSAASTAEKGTAEGATVDADVSAGAAPDAGVEGAASAAAEANGQGEQGKKSSRRASRRRRTRVIPALPEGDAAAAKEAAASGEAAAADDVQAAGEAQTIGDAQARDAAKSGAPAAAAPVSGDGPKEQASGAEKRAAGGQDVAVAPDGAGEQGTPSAEEPQEAGAEQPAAEDAPPRKPTRRGRRGGAKRNRAKSQAQQDAEAQAAQPGQAAAEAAASEAASDAASAEQAAPGAGRPEGSGRDVAASEPAVPEAATPGMQVQTADALPAEPAVQATRIETPVQDADAPAAVPEGRSVQPADGQPSQTAASAKEDGDKLAAQPKKRASRKRAATKKNAAHPDADVAPSSDSERAGKEAARPESLEVTVPAPDSASVPEPTPAPEPSPAPEPLPAPEPTSASEQESAPPRKKPSTRGRASKKKPGAETAQPVSVPEPSPAPEPLPAPELTSAPKPLTAPESTPAPEKESAPSRKRPSTRRRASKKNSSAEIVDSTPAQDAPIPASGEASEAVPPSVDAHGAALGGESVDQLVERLVSEAGPDGISVSELGRLVRAARRDFKVRDTGFSQFRPYVASLPGVRLERRDKEYRAFSASLVQ